MTLLQELCGNKNVAIYNGYAWISPNKAIAALLNGSKVWNEEDHPRDANGRFGSGGGSDSAGGESESSGGDKPAKPTNQPIERPASPGAAQKEILDRASKIEFSDEEPSGDSEVSSDDHDEIEARMTSRERAEMDEYLQQSAHDSAVELANDHDFSEEIGEFEPDSEWIASEAGYAQSDVDKAVSKIVAGDPELEAIASEYTSSAVGVDYIDELKDEIEANLDGREEGQENPRASEIMDQLTSYRDEAQGAIDEEYSSQEQSWRDNAEEEARDSYIDSLESDLLNDNSYEREQYLERFYEDNPDRFQAQQADGKWRSNNRGDEYKLGFKTSSGRAFTISGDAYDDVKIGEDRLGRIDVRFQDEQGNYGKSGKGEAFEIFGNVVPAVVALIGKEDPDVITFSAAGKSRQKLYDRLVKTVLSTTEGRFAKTVSVEGMDVKEYAIFRNSDRERVEPEMENLAATFGFGHRAGRQIQELEVRAADTDQQPQYVIEEVTPEINPDWFTPEAWADDDAAASEPAVEPAAK